LPFDLVNLRLALMALLPDIAGLVLTFATSATSRGDFVMERQLLFVTKKIARQPRGP
jgi:hypothetical protein